jgi:hypothetical protein
MSNSDAAEMAAALRGVLSKQTRALDLAIHSLSNGDGVGKPEELQRQKEVIETILLLIQGMGVSAHSIVRLTDPLDMAIRDCFGIARSICESGINVGYIVTCGSEAAARARQHALQKAYRDLERSGKLGGLSFAISAAKAAPSPEELLEIDEALKAFTSSKGREITAWTPDNVDARIKVIEQRHSGAAAAFAGSFLSIYRHASEILHGTYFSTVYFWTENGRPLKSRADAERFFVENHFVAVFSAVFFASHGVVEILAEEFDIPALRTANSALLGEVERIVKRYGRVNGAKDGVAPGGCDAEDRT